MSGHVNEAGDSGFVYVCAGSSEITWDRWWLVDSAHACSRPPQLASAMHSHTHLPGRPAAGGTLRRLRSTQLPRSNHAILDNLSFSRAHILQVRNVGLLSQHAVDQLVLRYRFIECRCNWPHKYFEQTVGAAYPITPMHQKGALRNAATHQSVHPIRLPICFSLGPTRLDGVRNCH